MKILAPIDSWNTDGVDIDSSSHIDVDGLYCYNGDDCVAVKSGMGPAGVRTGIPSTNITIRNVSSNGARDAFRFGVRRLADPGWFNT